MLPDAPAGYTVAYINVRECIVPPKTADTEIVGQFLDNVRRRTLHLNVRGFSYQMLRVLTPTDSHVVIPAPGP